MTHRIIIKDPKLSAGLIIIGGERKDMTDKLGKRLLIYCRKESLQSLSPRPPLPDPSFSSSSFSFLRFNDLHGKKKILAVVLFRSTESASSVFRHIRVVLLRMRDMRKSQEHRDILALRVRTVSGDDGVSQPAHRQHLQYV